jgi:hypothetical protein
MNLVVGSQGDNMWPYNDCEWRTLTYGISNMKKRASQKTKDKILLISLCILPYAAMAIVMSILIK